MLSGIGIICFAASYSVTLGLEISRLFFQLRVRWLVMIGFASAGLFAHSIYLWTHTQDELGSGTPFSSWYDWCLLGAWILAVAYLGLAIRRPHNTVGIFILPLVLALVGAAYIVRSSPPFARAQVLSYWGMIHGAMLLLGTVAAALGCAAGIMYLVQSYRLKRKLLPRPGFRLPSLEWLQRFNRKSLIISTWLVAIGLVAGLVLNVVRQTTRQGTVSWTDPIVISSGVLLFWLTTASLLELFYKPAREGRKVAYMTLASFVFLALALCLVLLAQHGIAQPRSDGRSSSEISGKQRQAEEVRGEGR